jgi:hypothetical protein
VGLDDENLETLELESPVGDRRRIDVEVGRCIFETKRDLTAGNMLDDAVEQLTGYVAERTSALGVRYIGVLTDGADWHAYTLAGRSRPGVCRAVRSHRDPPRACAQRCRSCPL